MDVLADHTVLPPDSAKSGELQELADVLGEHTEMFLVTSDGRKFKLSHELLNVLAHASNALADGRAVTLEPHRAVLSTQEAADLLGVSRPTLVRLLQSGEITYTKPGRHRRVRLEDVLAYQQRIRKSRRSDLEAMGTEAAKDDAYGVVNGFTETR